MNESKPESPVENDRAHHVQRALSIHDKKAMRRLMRDRTRNLANPRKFDVDKLPEYEAVTDRRKRRKAKEDGSSGQSSGGGNQAD